MSRPKGYKHTEETKRKISLSHIGSKTGVIPHSAFKPNDPRLTKPKVKLLCQYCKKEFFVLPHDAKERIFCSRECMKKGTNWNPAKGNRHPFWKGGISREYKTGYYSIEYKNWRREVFVRDSFICQKCNKRGGELHAHHIKLFSNYPKLRFNLNNGITFCKTCHRKKHSKIIGGVV